MSSGESVTLTLGQGSGDLAAGSAVVPYLVVLLECDRMVAPSTFHTLGGVDQVIIGRGGDGGARAIERASHQTPTLSVGVPDKRMSSRHVRLLKRFGSWHIQDTNSKNGTLLGGLAVESARLADGDVFEAGRTLFLFRNAALVPSGISSDRRPTSEDIDFGLATLSPAFEKSLCQLRSIARSEIPVVVGGETGTGKEVLARALHRLSGRSGAFILLPRRDHAEPGKKPDPKRFDAALLAAEGGTLFLDDLAEMALADQASLLQALTTRAAHALPRLVAASHLELRKRIAVGSFRADLFARLAGFEFLLPPLRQRPEDLGMLVRTLLAKKDAPEAVITPDAARLLANYDWPLNIRELEHAIASALACAQGKAIDAEHLPPTVRSGPTRPAEVEAAMLAPKDRALRAELLEALQGNDGNVSATARLFGKDRKQIQRWLKRFRIDAAQFRLAE